MPRSTGVGVGDRASEGPQPSARGIAGAARRAHRRAARRLPQPALRCRDRALSSAAVRGDVPLRLRAVRRTNPHPAALTMPRTFMRPSSRVAPVPRLALRSQCGHAFAGSSVRGAHAGTRRGRASSFCAATRSPTAGGVSRTRLDAGLNPLVACVTHARVNVGRGTREWRQLDGGPARLRLRNSRSCSSATCSSPGASAIALSRVVRGFVAPRTASLRTEPRAHGRTSAPSAAGTRCVAAGDGTEDAALVCFVRSDTTRHTAQENSIEPYNSTFRHAFPRYRLASGRRRRGVQRPPLSSGRVRSASVDIGRG